MNLDPLLLLMAAFAASSQGADGVVIILGAETQPGARLSTEAADGRDRTVCLTIDDVQGAYTIPYIQSGRDLDVSFRISRGAPKTARVSLYRQENLIAEQDAAPPDFHVCFPDLAPGEYTIELKALDADGHSVCRATYARIGIGTIIAAIGDSITEGYYGHGFFREDLNLRAGSFTRAAISEDGRNFPQFAPTTKDHLPSVNCFESWMTVLNDALNAAWRAPVFIANEGWGGITSEGYLHRMRTDANWQQRMRALRPQVWLIHLGVNDERAHVPPETLAANLDAIASLLIESYDAKPERILIAKPCYDYFEGAREMLVTYNKAIDDLIARRGFKPGADFFAAYVTDRTRWYGEDPVHPNIDGMKRMAELWRDAIVRQFPEGVK